MSNYFYDDNSSKKGGALGIIAIVVLVFVLLVIGVAAFLSLSDGDSLLNKALSDTASLPMPTPTAQTGMGGGSTVPETTSRPNENEFPTATVSPTTAPSKEPIIAGSYDDITGQSASHIIAGKNSPIKKIAQAVTPAIVGIRNLKSYDNRDGSGVDVLNSTGSGMILDKEGYIATNQHVVEGADKLTVVLFDGSEYEAELIGGDDRTDVAVIKLKELDRELTPVTLGNSSDLMVGQLVVAIGNPMGEQLAGSVTFGCVSGLDREMTLSDGRIMRLIQTDAAISSGNSGGALVNSKGEVIGINNMKAANSGTSAAVEGISFAIPIDTAKVIIDQLIETGHVTRPGIGISGYDIPASDAKYYNVPQGPVVAETIKGGGAEKAGILPNDIITHINSQRVYNFNEMKNILENFVTGDTVTVTVFREGMTADIPVTLCDVEQ